MIIGLTLWSLTTLAGSFIPKHVRRRRSIWLHFHSRFVLISYFQYLSSYVVSSVLVKRPTRVWLRRSLLICTNTIIELRCWQSLTLPCRLAGNSFLYLRLSSEEFLFRGLGYIVGDNVAKAFGNWQYALRVKTYCSPQWWLIGTELGHTRSRSSLHHLARRSGRRTSARKCRWGSHLQENQLGYRCSPNHQSVRVDVLYSAD